MEVIISHKGQCLYYPQFLSTKEADQLFELCKEDLNWQQDQIQFYGKKFSIPRFHCWYGSFDYSYSKIKLNREVMPPFLQTLRNKIENELGYFFNGVLGNLYRDGRDSNGWHRDNEKELARPLHLASISLGQSRYFSLRKKGETRMTSKIALEHGSLLLMLDPFQDYWEHQIPKTSKDIGERINLTFRKGEI
jgi:alkylated DNA repair dioxygenase AlkB